MEEQRLRRGRRGSQARPFCQRAQIQMRGYSRPLQRALTDFGAEESFGDAVKKMREHYGIEIGASAARAHTLAHAKAIGGVEHAAPPSPADTVIGELDGSMIPMVRPGAGLDQRKDKELYWKEARLCCARPHGAAKALYGATLGSVHLAGLLWRATVEAAGLGEKSHLHGLGDGAPWIMNTFEEQFGAQGKFTVDFWHVSQYLAQAALALAPGKNKEWLHQQQDHLRRNQVDTVLGQLEKRQEPDEQDEAPVRAAYGYLNARRDHLDYAGALATDLPIGSGEVEGGHRHVLQKRLKISGAWWLETTAQWMLQLRVKRANEDWEKYWSALAAN